MAERGRNVGFNPLIDGCRSGLEPRPRSAPFGGFRRSQTTFPLQNRRRDPIVPPPELGPIEHISVNGMSMGYRTGGSGFPKAITIEQMAEDTLAPASALQIERFDLMGWSMGSYISQQVAIDAPSRVAKLTATLEGQASAIDGWKATGAGSYEALPTLKMPTLVTWGNLDRGIRPRNDRIVARRIPNSGAVVFKGAGHAFLFQDPRQVGGTVDGFLG
jgi:pimeloyl-ACP methyl ester carboxylesterase